MPTSSAAATKSAYALEASTWRTLDGRIPGHPRHDPQAWAAWRTALHAALKAAAADDARRADGKARPG